MKGGCPLVGDGLRGNIGSPDSGFMIVWCARRVPCQIMANGAHAETSLAGRLGTRKYFRTRVFLDCIGLDL